MSVFGSFTPSFGSSRTEQEQASSSSMFPFNNKTMKGGNSDGKDSNDDSTMIHPNDSWQDVWDKMQRQGWKKWLAQYSSKTGRVQRFYPPGCSYSYSLDEIQEYAKKTYGWLGGFSEQSTTTTAITTTTAENKRKDNHQDNQEPQDSSSMIPTDKSVASSAMDTTTTRQNNKETTTTKDKGKGDKGDDDDSTTTIHPNDSWQDVWDKMQQQGWTEGNAVGGRLQFFYPPPCDLKRSGLSVIYSVHDLQSYAKKTYGWLGGDSKESTTTMAGTKRKIDHQYSKAYNARPIKKQASLRSRMKLRAIRSKLASASRRFDTLAAKSPFGSTSIVSKVAGSGVTAAKESRSSSNNSQPAKSGGGGTFNRTPPKFAFDTSKGRAGGVTAAKESRSSEESQPANSGTSNNNFPAFVFDTSKSKGAGGVNNEGGVPISPYDAGAEQRPVSVVNDSNEQRASSLKMILKASSPPPSEESTITDNTTFPAFESSNVAKPPPSEESTITDNTTCRTFAFGSWNGANSVNTEDGIPMAKFVFGTPNAVGGDTTEDVPMSPSNACVEQRPTSPSTILKAAPPSPPKDSTITDKNVLELEYADKGPELTTIEWTDNGEFVVDHDDAVANQKLATDKPADSPEAANAATEDTTAPFDSSNKRPVSVANGSYEPYAAATSTILKASSPPEESVADNNALDMGLEDANKKSELTSVEWTGCGGELFIHSDAIADKNIANTKPPGVDAIAECAEIAPSDARAERPATLANHQHDATSGMLKTPPFLVNNNNNNATGLSESKNSSVMAIESTNNGDIASDEDPAATKDGLIVDNLEWPQLGNDWKKEEPSQPVDSMEVQPMTLQPKQGDGEATGNGGSGNPFYLHLEVGDPNAPRRSSGEAFNQDSGGDGDDVARDGNETQDPPQKESDDPEESPSTGREKGMSMWMTFALTFLSTTLLYMFAAAVLTRANVLHVEMDVPLKLWKDRAVDAALQSTRHVSRILVDSFVCTVAIVITPFVLLCKGQVLDFLLLSTIIYGSVGIIRWWRAAKAQQ